jgi:hypothetical protein
MVKKVIFQAAKRNNTIAAVKTMILKQRSTALVHISLGIYF